MPSEQISERAARIDRRLAVLEQLYPGTNRVFADRDGEWSLPLLRREIAALSRNDIVEECAKVEWREIETAPKDGTWFIALQDGERYPCEWRVEEPDEGPPREGWFDHFNQSFEGPTHWRPLPDPPSLKQEQSDG